MATPTRPSAKGGAKAPKAHQGGRPKPKAAAPPPEEDEVVPSGPVRALLADCPISPYAVVATWALSIIGLGLSAYLTYVHFSNPTGLACPVSTHIDCAKVVTSSWSVIFGIPVPVYGLVFFVAMAAVNSPRGWRQRSIWLARGRVLACLVGVGMALWLVFVEVVKLDAICLWCTSVHILTLILFVTVAMVTVNAGLTLRED